MKKKLFFLITLIIPATIFAQATKSSTNVEQIWLGYFNQTRLSDKFGLWADLHLRTKENFTNNLSQSIVRLGLTYYVNDNTKLTAGYAYVTHYAAEGHNKISQPEHRIWQQLQWHTKYRTTGMMQWVRLEEKYLSKILNDSSLAGGYRFNYKVRYNLLLDIPFSTRPKNKFSFILNDEVHINFGKQIVYNYFDQNRLFAGFKVNITKSSNFQLGYMYLFQQLAAGDKYRNNHAARFFYFQNFDFRRKKAL